VRAPHPHHDLTALTEPDTGLVRAPVLLYLLERKLALSGRTLVPLTLVAMRVDGGSDARARVGALVAATLRSADSVGALDASHLAMLLDDTAETGGVWAAERVRTELAAELGAVRGGQAGRGDEQPTEVSFGVACYPTHAVDVDGLVAAALEAVAAGRQHGPNRIEVAHAPVSVGE
jgi:GGDEF domain-containing protein